MNDLSPQEFLAQRVSESELKNIDSNDEKEQDDNFSIFDDFEEKDKIYENTPICPEYIVPYDWDELFKLDISDKALDKLYIESKIIILAIEFSFIHNENFEEWLVKINESNYQKYEEEFEKQKNDENYNYNKLKKKIKEMKTIE